MAISYSWTFPQFEVAPSSDDLTDVVRIIHWRLDAGDGIYSAGSYGSVGLGAPDPVDFTPYDQITEQWAIDAVSANIDLDAVKNSISNEINMKKNPTTIHMNPPFASQD
jgi:hypothetical protein